jgi:hypothetical protein
MSLSLSFKQKRALKLQRKLQRAAYNVYKNSITIVYKKAAARIAILAAFELIFIIFLL